MASTDREPLTVVTAAVPREHREALERMAAKDDRTLSYLVRSAVAEYLHSSKGSVIEGGVSSTPGTSPDGAP